MKKLVGILFFITVVITTVINSYAGTRELFYDGSNHAYNGVDLSLKVNGLIIRFDLPPVIIDNRALVPVRSVFEGLGAVVKWDADTKKIAITYNNKKAELMINNKKAMVDGKQKVMDVPAKIINSRTVVPVRFISEQLGLNVVWNKDKLLISIEQALGTSSSVKNPVYYNQGDSKWGSIMYSIIDSSSQTIASSGCGPTSMAMVVSTLKKISVIPPLLSYYSVNNGYRTVDTGTKWSFFSDVSKLYGLKCEQVERVDSSLLKKVLTDGKHMTINSMKEGHVTNNGHFIVLNGFETVNNNLYFSVLDPNMNNSIYNKYLGDGSLIDSKKGDGRVLIREDVITKESLAYWIFF
jgi:hypothetical protein